MTASRAFWITDDFDREHAPDGVSRYGAEVRRRTGEFAESWGDISPVTFAVTAWRLGAGLQPGYVRWHRRIVSAACLFGQYAPPSEQDLTRSPHLRASLQVQAPVRLDDLPPAPACPEDGLSRRAQRAVAVVARELNDLVTPIIEQLEAGLPAGS